MHKRSTTAARDCLSELSEYFRVESWMTFFWSRILCDVKWKRPIIINGCLHFLLDKVIEVVKIKKWLQSTLYILVSLICYNATVSNTWMWFPLRTKPRSNFKLEKQHFHFQCERLNILRVIPTPPPTPNKIIRYTIYIFIIF